MPGAEAGTDPGHRIPRATTAGLGPGSRLGLAWALGLACVSPAPQSCLILDQFLQLGFKADINLLSVKSSAEYCHLIDTRGLRE